MSDASGSIPAAPPGDSSVAGPELPLYLVSKLRLDVPGYQLLEEIGHGGQATVYRAREESCGMTVAIKLLHGGEQADPAARERFRRESAALKALNHDNIVFGIADGRTPAGLDYLVMSYVDGRPLDALWTDRPFAAMLAAKLPGGESWRLRIFERACHVMQVAHRRGITHRDLSPPNILIDDDGEPHILDFGLASTAFDALHAHARVVSVTGQFLGKVRYASPEQAKGGGRPLDPRSDVYSLGVILYELLTGGAFPYDVDGAFFDIIDHILHRPPIRIGERLAARQGPGAPLPVPEALEAIVLKALEKDPDDRFENAGALGDAIAAHLGGRPTGVSLPAWIASVDDASDAEPDESPTLPTALPPAPLPRRASGVATTVLTAGITAAVLIAASRVVPSWTMPMQTPPQTPTQTPTQAPTQAPTPSPAAAPSPAVMHATPVVAVVPPAAESPQQIEADGIAKLEKLLVSASWNYYDSLYPPGGPVEFYGNGKFSRRWHWNYWVVGPHTMHVQFWDPDYDASKAVVFTFNDDLTAATSEFGDTRTHRVTLTRAADPP